MLGGLRARPNEIKPDPVDQPERTAHYDCAMCIAEICTILGYSTETVLLIDQHHCSDEAKWRLGGSYSQEDVILNVAKCYKQASNKC